MFCGTDNIMWNIPDIDIECRNILYIYAPISQNIIVELNDVMIGLPPLIWHFWSREKVSYAQNVTRYGV